MASSRLVPENIEERLIVWALKGAWIFYVMGALYIVGPVLGVALMLVLAWRSFAAPWRPPSEAPLPVPAGVVVWLLGMLAMLVALLEVHLSDQLGFSQTLKSAVGWMKGWALFIMFPLAGATLRVRPQLVVRAAGWFAVQTLALIPLLVFAGVAHLPGKLYVSPFQAVGGPGPEFFAVYLYIVDPSNGALRWQFIAPWAPAAGMLGNLLYVFAIYERRRLMQAALVICAVMMSIMTGSRMATLFLVLCPPIVWTLSRLTKPRFLIWGAVVSAVGGVVAGPVLEAVQGAVKAFRSARADSTRVREALGRIAVERWWEDAPIWGHGIVARGRHYVEFMPIGSHHTWFGLLYVKGAVGLVALLLPLLWTFVEMVILAQVTRVGRMGLALTILIAFYSFGENLEILSYLMWPGLILIGCAFRRGVARGPAKAGVRDPADLPSGPLVGAGQSGWTTETISDLSGRPGAAGLPI